MLNRVLRFFKLNPVVTAGLFNLAVIAAADLGFKVTANQLAAIVATAVAVLTAVVHRVFRKHAARRDF